MKKAGVLLLFIVSVIVFTGCASKKRPITYNWDKKNLLENPSFESVKKDKATVWGGHGVVRHNDPKAHSGKYYLMASLDKVKGITSQAITIPTNFHNRVDSGNAMLSFGGYQSGWKTQKDFGYVYISFYDINSKEIGSSNTRPFYSNHVWIKREGKALIPRNTRFIGYFFVGTRKEGSNNDAYLDDAFLYLGERIIGPERGTTPNEKKRN